MTSPVDVYGHGLLTTVAGDLPGALLRYEDGRAAPLDLPRWTGPAAGADTGLLDRCNGPVLDVGCGPGRLVHGLAARGVDCLGVDVAPVAVELARTGGDGSTRVLHASAFDPALDATRWATVLLADGNIGIGGDPGRLLGRCRSLLLPDGQVLVELGAPGTPTGTGLVRVESGPGLRSGWFRWSHVSACQVAGPAAAAGLDVAEAWSGEGRWFARLVRSDAGRAA